MIERGVLDAFRGDRARHLLELADELHVLAALLLRDVVRLLQQQPADEIEHDARMPRVAPLGFVDRMIDVAAIVRRSRRSRAR